MGLFDFAKDVGKKVFGEDDDPAEKLKDLVESAGIGIKDLGVKFKDGIASLTGTADDPEDVEKAVLITGNVEGVESVEIDEMDSPELDDNIEYYVIKSGDTLSAIAKKFLGDASRYPEIFEANEEVIKDPNLIFPGQKIRIPLD
ncbi:MAG: peptidoglycan-binding protein LysM [Leptospiraceae bacterium]|nr:peptidoglycan-binding protein LysM [Leptospiraceae bacterium]MCP5495865.1 peptidoglycan-binding protein LysM [Leptospiraceae bacterium]